MSVVGRGLAEGVLTPEEFLEVATEGLAELPVDGHRVLVLIPDGTRTMPMPLAFDALERSLVERVRALDFLVALGTHQPMNDDRLGALVGRPVVDGRVGAHRILNHGWEDPASFVTLGTIPAGEIEALTGGLLQESVPVALNRLVLDYDYILVCGPVFPHEVAGFSGGTKYLVPGIAGPEIINLTHWLGALIGSRVVIGKQDTPVRAVIDRAAGLLDRPLALLAPVVTREGIAGVFVGAMAAAWKAAARLSARRHVIWVEKPLQRVLSVMPAMYDDLWTAAKGVYKLEPAVADGGEIIVYAPHVDEVSLTHGPMIDEIGYHCLEYFTKQWDRFQDYPGGVLAHSTHVKGAGTYDETTGIETPRITVTLATGISEERCRCINLGYRDPADIDPAKWEGGGEEVLVVPRAGEYLYRVGRPPTEGNRETAP